MTDKELQQLARELVEEHPPIGIKDEVLRQNAIDLNTLHITKILQWLSYRYCLVEKSKLKQEYERNAEMYDLGSVVPATMGTMLKGKMELLESLFGKELFTDTEQ